jgi:hypothetical protein
MDLIEKQQLILDSNYPGNDFRRYYNSNIGIYQPNNSIRTIPLYKLSRHIANFDQNNHIPILICLEYDFKLLFSILIDSFLSL